MVGKKLVNPLENWGGKSKNQSDQNLLTQWEIEEKNQKTGGNVPLIDREQNGNVPLLDGKHNGDVLLICRNL